MKLHWNLVSKFLIWELFSKSSKMRGIAKYIISLDTLASANKLQNLLYLLQSIWVNSVNFYVLLLQIFVKENFDLWVPVSVTDKTWYLNFLRNSAR